MELAHDRTGAGSPLVLIHGITEDRSSWDPLVGPLAERFDVLTVDLRGHGRSASGDAFDPFTLAGDVHDTAVATGLIGGDGDGASPLVVGHSLGGVVATFYAATHAARGVINVDQGLRLGGFKDALSQLEPMLRGDEAAFRQALQMMFGAMAGPLAADEVARIESIRRPRQDVVLGIWSTVLESDVEELDAMMEPALAGVTAPYLAIHGSDPGAEYIEWLTRLIPSAKVEIWPEHGHYPHLVEPARFVTRVDQFASGLGL